MNIRILALFNHITCYKSPEWPTRRCALTRFADSYQVGRGDVGVLTEGVEENRDGESEVARLELPAGPNLCSKALHRGHRLEAAV